MQPNLCYNVCMSQSQQSPKWRALSVLKITKLLGVEPSRGLSKQEIGARVAEYGWNRIPEPRETSIFFLWLRQFISPLIGVLLFASASLFLVDHYSDAIVILSVLLINSWIGTFHEYRTTRRVRALRRLTPERAVVLRDARAQTIPAYAVVPGDVLIISEGDRIVADARLVETNYLRVNESLLTGESLPVAKDAESTHSSRDPLDAPTMVRAGTTVTHGGGRAIVVETGARTRLGSISARIQESHTPVPLERDLAMLSRIVLCVIATLVVLIFLVGLRTALAPIELLFISISLAVAAIPEGLPIVLTIVLSIGVARLARRGALVKKMFAVEALGQVEVLALDKTGTITLGEMMVVEIRTPDGAIKITGNGYEPTGSFFRRGTLLALHELSEFQEVAGMIAPVVSATILKNAHGGFVISGDATEAALLVVTQKLHAETRYQRENYFPFDYDKKYALAAARSDVSEPRLVMLGAPEHVLAACTSVRSNNKIISLSTHEHDALAAELQAMAENGLRVIALASGDNTDAEWDPHTPSDLTFEAFFGIADAIRPTAAATIARVKGAGLRVVMITGDLPAAARTVAREVGIFQHGDRILTGHELHSMNEAELRGLLPSVSVFARVTPEDKLRIIELYQKMGHTIAMTGDGVNDAPSLVAANIGIALARSGTDVARQAADILLLDDELESIAVAIDEGRTMYQTMRKVLLYLFSTNFGEICVIGTALILGIPSPITAVQIIWLNLVTDGFLDVALALEPKEDGARAPKSRRSKYLLHGRDLRAILQTGFIMTVGTLGFFMYHTELSLPERRTAALILLAMFQWVHAWMTRTELRSAFSVSPFKNKYLIGATIIVLALQLVAVYIPTVQHVLGTAIVPAKIWAEAFSIASCVVVLEEIKKYFRRHT